MDSRDHFPSDSDKRDSNCGGCDHCISTWCTESRPVKPRRSNTRHVCTLILAYSFLSFFSFSEDLSLARRKTPCRTQPPLLTLLEIRKYAPFLIRSGMEIYLDGGIRRGSDVVKALALGATAVGLGRPFLYSLPGYGQSGVKRMVQVLRDEIVTNMALTGARSISEIVPEMVNVSELERNLIGSIKL